MEIQNSFYKGLKDGLPIGLGYLSVAFTFGIMAAAAKVPLWVSVAISMTCLTSAGQFAGLTTIIAGGGYIEIALAQLIINLRYCLMSLSLSQKVSPKLTSFHRSLVAFCNTDEIFAVAVSQDKNIGGKYVFGLALLPYVMWSGGTLLGGLAGGLLPEYIQSALNIAIYGMFIAIFVPVSKKSKSVLSVVLISVAISCLFKFTPVLNQLSSGFVIIICTLVASTIGAILFPLKD